MRDLAGFENNNLNSRFYKHSQIPGRAFKRGLSQPYDRFNYVKRDADAFKDELSRRGLVYVVKGDQQKREADPILMGRDATNEKRRNYGNLTVAEIIEKYGNHIITINYDTKEQGDKYLKEIQQIFKNPPETKINADGWPDKSIYDPAKDLMFWWRNDPVANQHHEHWHIVMISAEVDGVTRDREGENFIYMHRHMLARYDADRLGCGLEIVEPLPDYITPIPEAFYPDPYLSQDNDSNPSTPRVWFPARPVNETIKNIVEKSSNSFTIYTVKFLNKTYNELEKWIDHKYTRYHPVQLGWNDSEANNLGSEIESILHNLGHEILGFLMHPYTIGYPPSVLVGARAGLRDPLFWMWHRHLDNLYLKFQNNLGPNDLLQDSPNVTIRSTDVYLAFTDVLLKVAPNGRKDDWQAFGDKTFGGSKFDLDCSNETVVTKELQTKMKNRTLVWREDNYDKENITYVYPRDWYYFFRVKNDVDIKTEEQMDSTQLNMTFLRSLTKYDEKEVSELLFCDCGWPYNMIIPRGNREGMKFKMIIYISDGLNDLLPTYDQCGSTLLCGGQKWEEKVPDSKPFGYPFNRPFKNDSYELTFKGLNNVVIHDFTIRLVDNFAEV
ncbi:11206_t:CDS:2 [Acaulospora colombiana]|uniref:11206_t:CDS:1 n=1 Tax=Acaulospora colombiana TaxID=27376 RepID=A0ACA9KFB0_9GLOM|nr:11206_t:CDS:2 [Acaulospora colombiana]